MNRTYLSIIERSLEITLTALKNKKIAIFVSFFRLVFLLGIVPDANTQNSVMSEAMQYRDIVQGRIHNIHPN